MRQATHQLAQLLLKGFKAMLVIQFGAHPRDQVWTWFLESRNLPWT